MALNFTRVTLDVTGKAVKPAEFTPEFIEEFNEAWGELKSGDVAGLSVEFDNHADRVKWFNKAVAYGKQNGVSVTKMKGTDSDNKEHGKLTFRMETTEAKEARMALTRAAADRREVLAAMGRTSGKGKKSPEIQAGDDAALSKFYALTAAKQEEKLTAYREKVAAEKAAALRGK